MGLRTSVDHIPRMPGHIGEGLHRWAGASSLRWLWCAILLIHTPALIRTWKALLAGGLTGGMLEGCFWLSASTLFFVLKAYRSDWLRFRTDARSLAILGLALVLLHTGPLGLRRGEAARTQMPAAAVLLLAGLECVQAAMLAAFGSGRLGATLADECSRLCVAVSPRPRHRACYAPHFPRAPPA